jgi:hypothetical protein
MPTQLEKSQEIIAADKKRRAEACVKELQQILTKNKCTIIIEGKFSAGQCVSEIVFVAND